MSLEIRRMFSDIAPRYDLANDVLSFGIHRLWRAQAISFGKLQSGTVLDLCCGTGAQAYKLIEKLDSKSRVVGLDFSAQMLSLALSSKQKSKNAEGSRISFVQGDALSLPFPRASFDAVTVSFGIRNVTDPLAGLHEIHRVLKPGGTVLIVEFGQVNLPVFSSVYSLYSRSLMPLIGGLITGNRQAYEYLPKTSREFPAGPAFEKLLENARFSELRMRSLFGGLAYVYTGFSALDGNAQASVALAGST